MNMKYKVLSLSLISAAMATAVAAADHFYSFPEQSKSPMLLSMNEAQEESTAQKSKEGVESSLSRTGQAIDDVKITASLKAKFVEDPALSADDINIDTANGVVTLSGTAMSNEAKDHATDVAEQMEGVVAVDNRLEVGPPESIGEKAAGVIDNAVITTKVKTKLIAEKSLSAAGINVDTAKGVVTLSGTVSTEADKEKAEMIAAAVEGVYSVDNRLEVK